MSTNSLGMRESFIPTRGQGEVSPCSMGGAARLTPFFRHMDMNNHCMQRTSLLRRMPRSHQDNAAVPCDPMHCPRGGYMSRLSAVHGALDGHRGTDVSSNQYTVANRIPNASHMPRIIAVYFLLFRPTWQSQWSNSTGIYLFHEWWDYSIYKGGKKMVITYSGWNV